jgi:hypothetical protein
MKAFELSGVLTSLSKNTEAGMARDGLRYLSSALSQLGPSKTASAALSELREKLSSANQAPVGSARFADLEAAVRPLAMLVEAAGTKAAREAFGVLLEIISGHGEKSVQAAEGLLAAPLATRTKTKRPPPVANEETVRRHLVRFQSVKAGTNEFGVALATLNLELDEKTAKLADLKCLAERLQIPYAGTSRKTIMSALSREHDTILETLAKIRSGSNAA